LSTRLARSSGCIGPAVTMLPSLSDVSHSTSAGTALGIGSSSRFGRLSAGGRPSRCSAWCLADCTSLERSWRRSRGPYQRWLSWGGHSGGIHRWHTTLPLLVMEITPLMTGKSLPCIVMTGHSLFLIVCCVLLLVKAAWYRSSSRRGFPLDTNPEGK